MIHYHGTPYSGTNETALALAGRHAMVSYAHPRQIDVAAELCQSFALDNGAFSIWKRGGGTLDIAGFAVWAEHWLKHPGCDFALAPDIIDGSEADNDALLVNLSRTKWVPVWHMHESLMRLERLVSDWPRVALGSSGQYATIGTPAWWARMAEAMDCACDAEGRPLARLHGLRMLDPTVFSHLPLASADSTNVARNIGIDSAWRGSYSPHSQRMRALILQERIERHASAARWCRKSSGVAQNFELLG